MKILDRMNEFIHYNSYERFIVLGKSMPYIAILYSSLFLLYKHRYRVLLYFFVYLIINTAINGILKATIQEQRPIHSNYKAYTMIDNYGMPSGHAQTLGFITGFFLYKYPKQHGLLFLNILNSVLTSFQRIYSEYHTEKQVIVGLLVGFIVGITAGYMV